MSAERLRGETVARISDLRDRAVEYSLNARFRPSTYGDTYIPAATAEEIALQVIEGNALARAYTSAIETINEVYRQMFQPDDDKKPEPTRKEIY